jgi:hypothetical protein
VSDIETVVVDSLKALDLKRPIRDADMATRSGLEARRAAAPCPAIVQPRENTIEYILVFHTASFAATSVA